MQRHTVFSPERRPCIAGRVPHSPHTSLADSVFARITGASCHSRFDGLRRALRLAISAFTALYCALLPADDALVMVRHINIGSSDRYFLRFSLTDHICPECFLGAERRRSSRFYSSGCPFDGCRCPFGFPKNRFDLIFFQPVLHSAGWRRSHIACRVRARSLLVLV